MATTSSVSGSGINVSQIVSGLMEVARTPVNTVQTQVDKKTTVISSLGTLKSKVSTLEVASRKIQDSWLFAARSVSSTDSSKVSASATTAAREGSYSVKVAQTALAETVSMSGFAGAQQIMDLSGFRLEFEEAVYEPVYAQFNEAIFSEGSIISLQLSGGQAQNFTISGDITTPEQIADAINAAVSDSELEGVVATLNDAGKLQISSINAIRGVTASLDGVSAVETREGLSSRITVTEFKDMLNLLDAGVQASLVQVASDSYSLMISSKETGVNQTIVITGVQTPTKIAQEDRITLSGTYSAGEKITMTVDSIEFEYEITEDDVRDGGSSQDDHARIAAAIVEQYNASGSRTAVSASASGRTITLLADVSGTAFDAAVVTSGAGSANRSNVVANYSLDSVDDITIHSSEQLQQGRDAFLSVNGLVVQRSSNEITDVIDGVTISLNSPVTTGGSDITALAGATALMSGVAATTLNVTTSSTDSSAEVFRGFVTAFNDLMTYYREQTVASTDATKRGALASDAAMRSFMDRLRGLYSNGIRLADGSDLMFSQLGIVRQVDGTLEVDEADLTAAVADGLQAKLSDGVIVGYESSSLNLTKYLTDSLKKEGAVYSRITSAESEKTRLQDKISELEIKLSILETRYYKQYGALDSLLMRLQTQQAALTSALAGLTSNNDK